MRLKVWWYLLETPSASPSAFSLQSKFLVTVQQHHICFVIGLLA